MAVASASQYEWGIHPIQWYSELSILDTELIHFNILPPYWKSQWKRPVTQVSVQGNQIEINTLVERSQNFQNFKEFIIYLDRRYDRFCTSTSKKLECITQRSLRRRRLML